jgi:hypothetical protein
MSVLMQELMQAVTTEVGVRVEDAYEAAKRDINILEGQQAAFLNGASAIELLTVAVDKDVEEGKFDLVVAETVKRYISRCVNSLRNLSLQAASQKIAQEGKAQAFAHTVELLKTMSDTAKHKAAALRAEETQPPVTDPRDRMVGTRPPESIKEQRLAEEAEEKATQTKVAEEEAAKHAAVTLPVPPPPRSRRKTNGHNA